MTDQKLIDDVVTAFADRDLDAPSRDDIARVLEVFETSLRRCGCDACTTARRERIGLTEHDLTSLARVLHEVVYSPGASFDRAVPGIQEYMHACAEKVAAALPWVVPTPEVELVVTEAHTPTDDEREAQGWREAALYAEDAESQDDFMTGWRTADRTPPEVPEPSAAMPQRFARAKLALTRALSRKEWREDGWEVPAIDVQEALDALSRSEEPRSCSEVHPTTEHLVSHAAEQDEPSDAQVEAALIAHLGYDPAPAGFPFKDDEKDQMRAALRAAEEAKR